MAADSLVLAGDSSRKPSVLGVGRIIFRLRAEKIHVEIEFNGMPGDPQIVKVGTEKADRGNVTFERVFGGDLGNHTVGRHHIKDVQVFDDRGGEGFPAAAGLDFFVPRYLGVGGTVGHNSLHAETLGVLRQVTTVAWDLGVSLPLDFLGNGQPQAAGKGVGLGVVRVFSLRFIGHGCQHFPSRSLIGSIGRNVHQKRGGRSQSSGLAH